MDGLIGLIITIGIFALSSSSRKKKKTQERWRTEYLERKNASQKKIPFSKEEWTAFLKEQAQDQKAKPAAKSKKSKPVPQPDPVLHLDHDEPEGTISTQGESIQEHAQHQARILEEETLLVQQHETLQELRRMNTQKLRNAVVMSEVLGKPVSLRPRGIR